MVSNQQIADYYDTTQIHYEQWWNLRKSQSLHYGLWFPETKNFTQALENTNAELLKLAAINSADYVLDAGCGVGGAAQYIHQQVGAKITGITLSRKQLELAHSLNKSKEIQFKIEDATKTNFDSESFDVVWACESVCHMDKLKFSEEAFRLLKPGGRLVMADFFISSEDQTDEKQLIRKWADTWGVDEFASAASLQTDLKAAGFTKLKALDYTPQIEKSAYRLYLASLLGAIPSELYNLTHRKVSTYAKNHYKCGIYQYKALKAGFWRYMIFVGIKE